MRIRSRGRREGGLTLVELIVATALLAVGIAALVGLVVSAQIATRGTNERTIARERLHARVAELRALLRSQPPPQAFDDVVNLDQTTTTPPLVDGAPAATLRVITFRRNTGGVDEVAANAALLPLGVTNVDIDGDGDLTGTDVAPAQLQIVPVIVRITWKSGTWKPGTPTVANGDPGQDAKMEIAALLY